MKSKKAAIARGLCFDRKVIQILRKLVAGVAAAQWEAVGHAEGEDRIGFERIEIALPLGDLTIEAALYIHRGGVRHILHITALGLRLVLAGPAREGHIYRGLAHQCDARLEGK